MNYFLITLYFLIGLIGYGNELLSPTVPGFYEVESESSSDRFLLHYDEVVLQPGEQIVTKFGTIPSSEDDLRKPQWKVSVKSLGLPQRSRHRLIHTEFVMYESEATRDAYGNVKELAPAVVEALRVDKKNFSSASNGHYGHLVITNHSEIERTYEIIVCKSSDVHVIKQYKANVKKAGLDFKPLKKTSEE